ncbi:ParA family protein [Pannonibacter sp. Q-1]|uniref:Chromosome partitioning protein ParA n=1 Tax=Pannonibacter phragmitetus TaxID=121719 RepID=A0A0L0J5Y9_9HYPH|nr:MULTISPECIES: ParA family protein [Pannonibacter]ALV29721.1 chromosome partitioning protein ParA [Pannonibacter phragmitetus]KND21066.1 chromosome partitioning protein ParA [Pannonibacter phragmitetus]MBA4203535.1 iron-sulfur cluster carrier protein ApbC [Polymorphum sp.]
MPVISFANAKGGAGKTTAALLLATEIAERGMTVTIFDADPQRWISTWSDLPGRPANISVQSQLTPATITEQIIEASAVSDYVIVDLEGTENLLVANALSVSDLVVVPIQGSSMDARGGAKILRLITKLEEIVRHEIRHCVVLTRTNAAVTTRALKAVQDHLAVSGIDVLMTAIVERAAYRDMFEFGGSLATLDPKLVTNLDKARDNAALFAAEVLERIQARQQRRWYDWFRKAS